MITLEYDSDAAQADLVRDGANLQTDETLETAALISLFTRRRAADDDPLPDPLAISREGWWADPYADVDGDQIGSRLWLLRRSKATRSTRNRARTYILEALQWLVDDGVAASIDAEVERHDNGVLAFRVEIVKPTKPATKWAGFWEAHLALL